MWGVRYKRFEDKKPQPGHMYFVQCAENKIVQFNLADGHPSLYVQYDLESLKKSMVICHTGTESCVELGIDTILASANAQYEFFGDTLKEGYYDSIYIHGNRSNQPYRFYFDKLLPNIHNSVVSHPHITYLPTRIALGSDERVLVDEYYISATLESMMDILEDDSIYWWTPDEIIRYSRDVLGMPIEDLQNRLDEEFEELMKKR